MKLTVKIIGKEVVANKQKFTNYSLLTAGGKWYKVAGIDKDELKDYINELVTIDVSRKFDKKVTTKDGREVLVPTLVIDAVYEASNQELLDYKTKQDELNASSLVDIE
jgi:hypothetical protein